MSSDGFRPRINGSMLHNNVGRDVILLGIAHDVDANGTSFQLKASDGQEVSIMMNEPLSDYVNGLTEVHGKVQADGSVSCDNYIVFTEDDATNKFEMNQYNRAVELMQQVKGRYITGIPAPV